MAMTDEHKQFRKKVREFVRTMEIGVRAAQMGKFSPESENFIKTKHDLVREGLDKIERLSGENTHFDKIRALMDELEGEI